MKVISIGEVLWDVVGSVEHLGGASFNFAAHLARLGHEVIFISTVGKDERGQRILRAMPELGLTPCYVREADSHPTGFVTVTLTQGQPSYVLHRPAAYDFPGLTAKQCDELAAKNIDWIYFGTLSQIGGEARQFTAKLLQLLPRARRFYDVNLRRDSWNPQLLRSLAEEASVMKLNDEEVPEVARALGQPHESLRTFCIAAARACRLDAICVTRGARGCALLIGNDYVEAEGRAVQVADTVGAGDAFAAGFLHGLGSGWDALRIAEFANRVGALVASRPGAIPPWSIEEVETMKVQTHSDPA